MEQELIYYWSDGDWITPDYLSEWLEFKSDDYSTLIVPSDYTDEEIQEEVQATLNI